MLISKSHRVYTRDLPGCGFVAIDVHSRDSLARGRTCEGDVLVERRRRDRPGKHSPPVLRHMSGRSLRAVVQQLLLVAENNAAVGAALLRLQRSRLVSRQGPSSLVSD